MKKKVLTIVLFILLSLVLFSCNMEKESISIYLWSNVLINNGYAQYIQNELPDIKIDFIVGNNDLDYYQFMKDNNSLPDIITCRRFSLHDAIGLKDQLMDLSTTEEAGAIYDSYIKYFTNEDNTVSWLPVCGELDGIVINKALFENNNIPVPTDYESFVYACNKFEEIGIKGFEADFLYDYTCMEILQGLSIPELSSSLGKVWRNEYESISTGNTGLDTEIWPKAFEVMEKFINDTKLTASDIKVEYSSNYSAFLNGKVAMIRSGGNTVISIEKNENMDPLFIPYFGQNGEEWLLTYPAFQLALNKDLGNDLSRKSDALRILKVMMSEEGQKILSSGNEIVSYSQGVNFELDERLSNLQSCIDQNHLYIRIASNDFFSISKTVVSKMITKEYSAEEAYNEFDRLLKSTTKAEESIILSLDKSYDNKFGANGNEAFSVMSHTLREMYKCDILISPSTSFTGTVISANYTEAMVENMIMPNPLEAYRATITGERLKRYIKGYVEGKNAGYTPFSDATLPVLSGISLVVRKEAGKYIVEDILKDGVSLADDEEFNIIVLSVAEFMGSFLNDSTLGLVKENYRVRKAWVNYIKNGGTILEPEKYISFIS